MTGRFHLTKQASQAEHGFDTSRHADWTDSKTRSHQPLRCFPSEDAGSMLSTAPGPDWRNVARRSGQASACSEVESEGLTNDLGDGDAFVLGPAEEPLLEFGVEADGFDG